MLLRSLFLYLIYCSYFRFVPNVMQVTNDRTGNHRHWYCR